MDKNIYSDDKEIDLIELISILWSKKTFIAIVTGVVFLLSLIYAFMAKQVWTSSLDVSAPSSYQFSNYSNSVNEVMSFVSKDSQFNVDGLSALGSSKYLFNLFLSNFNSQLNKTNFLKNTNAFKDAVKSKKITSILQQNALLLDLAKTLSFSQDKSTLDGVSVIRLNAQSSTSEKSFLLLKDYATFITALTKKQAISNLISNTNNYQSFLNQKLVLLNNQASAKLKTDILKTQYALDIANGANVINSIPNLKGEQTFNVQLGKSLLENKLKVLKTITDASVLNPKIASISSQFNDIKAFKIDSAMSFDVYQKQSSLMVPLSRTSPHRGLIAALGLLIGLVLSCLIVLIKKLLTKNKHV